MMYGQLMTMGFGAGGGALVFWITTVLVWMILILGIIALLRWLKRNQ